MSRALLCLSLLLTLACSKPEPAAPAAPAAPAPAQPAAADHQEAPLPVGTWYYDVREPGVQYKLEVKETWARFSALGVKTEIWVEGELRRTDHESFQFVVTRDIGSQPPYAVGTQLFKVRWSGSAIVGENTEANVLETMGGAVAPFTQSPPPPAVFGGSCGDGAWKCDGQSVLKCQGKTWVLADTCDPEHRCVEAGAEAVCMDNEG